MSKIFDNAARQVPLHTKLFIDILFAADMPLNTYFDEIRYARTCDECGAGMNEGYCICNGEQYYCSDECLHKHFTKEEWLEMYADGEGDSYYTEWDPETDCD